MRPRVVNFALLRPRFSAVLLLLCLLAIAPSSTASDEAGRGTGFEAFRILVDRNIFNHNRKPAPQPGGAARAQQDYVAPQAADRLALVGALIDEFGAVAFFSGSKAEYQGVTKQGDSIAGFVIEKIESERIVLRCNGIETVLAVGTSMEREEGGEWQIRDTGGFAQVYIAPPTPSDSIAGTTDESDSASEVLKKRMIERRRREAKP